MFRNEITKLLKRKSYAPTGPEDVIPFMRDLSKNLNSVFLNPQGLKSYVFKKSINNPSGSSVSGTFEIFHDLRAVPSRVTLDYVLLKDSSNNPVNYNPVQFVVRSLEIDRVIIYINITSSVSNITGDFSVTVE